MIILLNILLITLSHTTDNGTSKYNEKYFNQNFFVVEINLNSPAEYNSENYISTNSIEKERKINNEFSSLNNTKEVAAENIYTSFILRLLPFLIDEPPPSFLA